MFTSETQNVPSMSSGVAPTSAILASDSDVPTPTVSRSGRGLAAPDRLIEKIEPGAAAQLKKMRNFSGDALAVLERVFAARQQPDARQLAALAVVLGATRERVDLWFERQRRCIGDVRGLYAWQWLGRDAERCVIGGQLWCRVAPVGLVFGGQWRRCVDWRWR